MNERHSLFRAGTRRHRRLLRQLFIACIAMGLSYPALAIDTKPPSVSDFQRITYEVKSGAPEKTWSMTQTSDGWIWFGGPSGLTRFDGVEFEKVDVATADGRLSSGVSVVQALPSGGLYVGHLSGGVSIYQHGHFTRFESDGLLAAGRPGGFTEGEDGILWCSFASGLMRFDGSTWTPIGQEWNLPSGSVQLALDGSGTLWAHVLKHVLRLTRGSRTFEWVADVEEPGLLLQSPSGEIVLLGLVGTSARTRRWPGQRPDRSDTLTRYSGSTFYDDEGHLWSTVLSPSNDSEVAKARVTGLSEFGVISSMLQDSEGNVWIAQLGKLHRLRRAPIVPVISARQSASEKVDSAWINVISDREGTIWFAHQSTLDILAGSFLGTLWSVKDGTRPDRQEAAGNPTQVASDANGNVWVAGISGLWERAAAGFTKRAEFDEAKSGFGIAAGCAGGVWASVSRRGLRRFSQGDWKEQGGATTLPEGIPTALHCDQARNLWLGYGNGRVIKVDEGLTTTAIGFVGPGIGAIASISVGRHTFVGGSSGVAVLGKDGFRRLSSRLPILEGITGIAESADGNVWLNGARGLIRIWTSDLPSDAGLAEVRTQLFDADDGFPAPAYSLALPISSVALDKEQRVWLSGLGGLGFIDPRVLPTAPQTPTAVFKAIVAGGRTFEPAGIVSMPQGTRSLEITYTTLRSLHADRLRFRYRLDGVDDDWVNVEGRRRATYTNLPPGKHRFQVNVSDELGAWTTHPSTLTFEIPPTFIQSSAFKAMCVATLLALLVFAYRLRVRHLERRHDQLLVERLDERERIARELHDTLLQGTQALIMKVHAATKLVGKDEPIHQALDKALDQATGVLVEARNRIEDLRVRESPGDDDLPTLLVAFGQELVHDGSPRFDAYVEGTARKLAPAVFQEAALIGREALTNAFQHAKATTVELQIEFTNEEFRMRVRDDGRGFDDTALERPRSGRHWGLPGMQERARVISAAITIWSRPGAGTEVELRVPGNAAYATQSERRRWSTLRSAFARLG